MEPKRSKTIEEMIAEGAPWELIKIRIDELQQEQKKKEAAAMAAKIEKQKKLKERAAIKERFINSFVDWLVAEEVIDSEEKELFRDDIKTVCNDLMKEMKQAAYLKSLLKQFK
jgi:hypothetical protein